MTRLSRSAGPGEFPVAAGGSAVSGVAVDGEGRDRDGPGLGIAYVCVVTGLLLV